MTMTMQNISKIELISIDKIIPSPFQPRQEFDKIEIEEMVNSIHEFGQIQPIIVKPMDSGNYRIIAGERRWRAFQLAGREKIEAIVKDIPVHAQRILSLIENVHRKDLSVVEKGRGVIEVFRSYNIDVETTKIIGHLRVINNKKRRPENYKNNELTPIENEINEIFKKIGKGYSTTETWLQSTTVSDDILKVEETKSEDEKIAGGTLARLGTIADEALQKETYTKIVESDDMRLSDASKFITEIKKAPEDIRRTILEPGTKVNLSKSGQIRIKEVDETEYRPLVDWEENDDYDSTSKIISTPQPIKDQTSTTMREVTSKTIEEPPIKRHVDSISPAQLNHEKNRWNVFRFSQNADFFTTGTDGKKVYQFMDLLDTIRSKTNGKKLLLVDIRATPFSRYKPEFNKENIRLECEKKGFDYIHLQSLGVPKEQRTQLYSGELSENDLWKHYENHILTKDLKSEIKSLMTNGKRIVFLCTEVSPTRCHRHVIARWLENESKLKGWDL